MTGAYHEPPEELSESTRDLHRAFRSLIEELDAVDWYQHRIDVSNDEDLKALLAHNRDEEMEHAAMLIEYLRRRLPKFDEELRTYLYTTAPITRIEELKMAGEAAPRGDADPSAGGDLGIGSLR